MPVLTRSASATHLKKAYLTPQTPPSTNSRALDDMTPLPSLLDKMVEVAKCRTRSTSLQLTSKKPSKSPSIPEGSERPSFVPAKDRDIDQASDAPTEVEDEPEPEPVFRQSSVTSDYMDYEDTPITFSEPVNSIPPPAPAPPTPLIHEVVMDPSPPSQHSTHQLQGPHFTLPSAHQEPLLLSELNNSAIFPHQTSYYNPPSTSSNHISCVSLQEQVLFRLLHTNERPQRTQPVVYDTTYSQHPTPAPPTHPTALPFLSASAPVETDMRPVVLPVLAQTLPAFATSSRPDLQRREPNVFCKQLPQPTLAETRCRPMSTPQAQQPPQLGSSFVWRYRPCPRVPRWRIRENERQKEMDRIAEPYLLRLQEISRQKNEAEARALAGQQKTGKAKEQGKSWWDFLREDEKKMQKELKAVERQQRSEEKRQTRKDSREKRRRRKSDENTQPEGLEQEGFISPGRKRTSRSKPYNIPHPVTRSPRRSHIMPGGFDSDDLTLDHQTSVACDAHGLWKDFKSAVDEGYRLWTQGR